MKKTKLLVTTLVSILATCGCNNEASSSTTSQASNSIVSTSSSSNLVTYKMAVKAINGMILKNVTVDIYDEDVKINSLVTDYYGQCEINLEKKEYKAKLINLPKGMYNDAYFILKENEINDLYCYASPIEESAPSATSYNVGDLMYDFSFYNIKSKKEKLSSNLNNKKGVILNFWGTTCIPCQEEFPLFEKLYGLYKDQIEIIALSVEDGITSVANYKEDNDYTFKMGIDINGLTFRLFRNYFGDIQAGSYSIPATVFIDKYGFVHNIVSSSYVDYEELKSNCLDMINKYN